MCRCLRRPRSRRSSKEAAAPPRRDREKAVLPHRYRLFTLRQGRLFGASGTPRPIAGQPASGHSSLRNLVRCRPKIDPRIQAQTQACGAPSIPAAVRSRDGRWLPVPAAASMSSDRQRAGKPVGKRLGRNARSPIGRPAWTKRRHPPPQKVANQVRGCRLVTAGRVACPADNYEFGGKSPLPTLMSCADSVR